MRLAAFAAVTVLALGGPAWAQQTAIDKALESEITVSFAGTALPQVVEAIRGVAQLNLLVDPRVRAPSQRFIRADSSGQPLRLLLDAIQSQAKLTRTAWCGAVVLHEEGQALPSESSLGVEDRRFTQAISVNLALTPFMDAVERLKTRAGIEFVIPADVRRYLQQEAVRIDLRFWSLEVRHIITHVTRDAGLTWDLKDGKVVLGLGDRPQRDVAADELDVKLGDLEGMRAKEDLPALLRQLSDPVARPLAVQRLILVGDSAAQPVADFLLATRDDPQAARAALQVLSKIGGEQQVVVTLRVFRDPNRSLEVRTEAGLALGALKSLAAVPTLIEALDDPWFKISETARAALVAIGEPAVPYVQRRFRDEIARGAQAKDGIVFRSLLIFGAVGGESCEQVLLWALRQKGEDDRAVALRHHAAIGLGFTGERRLVEPLIQALEGEKVFLVAKYITRSLNWITDAGLPPEGVRWRTWLSTQKEKDRSQAQDQELFEPVKPDFGDLPKLDGN